MLSKRRTRELVDTKEASDFPTRLVIMDKRDWPATRLRPLLIGA